MFFPCGGVLRTVAGALVEQGDEQKARVRPAFQLGLKFGPVEFRNFEKISGAPGPCCHGVNAVDGVQAGICFFTIQEHGAFSLFLFK